MGFMKGTGAIRRSIKYLSKNNLILNHKVKILALHHLHNKPQHSGLRDYAYWHLAQIRYQNPKIHIVTFKKFSPNPWIKAYLDDGNEVVIDCENRSREEIQHHVNKILGKSEERLELEKLGKFDEEDNIANFGKLCERQCICEVPGQFPCPGWQTMPTEMTGKYKAKKYHEEKEANM